MQSVRRCSRCNAVLASDNQETLCSPCSGTIDFPDAILALICEATDQDIEDVANVLRPMYVRET